MPHSPTPRVGAQMPASYSKRNLILRGWRGRRRRCTALTASARWSGGSIPIVASIIVALILATTAATAAALGADHLHPLADDAELGALLPVLFPGVVLQSPLDQQRR